jgi:hypothetical protein
VFSRNRRMVQNQIVPLGSADGHLPMKVGGSLNAEVDVVNLKRVHEENRL